jgi:ribonuclease P protein component
MGNPTGKEPTASFGRLRKRKEIDRVYKVGVRVRGTSILMAAGPGMQTGETRLALAVGKKYHKSAVERNRLRRLFRASLQRSGWAGPHLDIVLSPLRAGLSFTEDGCRKEVLELLQEASHKLQS